MDLVTFVGLIGAFGVIIVGILLGSSLSVFYDAPSVAIVGFGTILASMTSFRGKDLKNLIPVVKNAFFTSSKPIQSIAQSLIEMSIRARKEGLLALESVIGDAKDPFVAKGIQLVVDGHEVENVDRILSAEIEALDDRHKQGAALMITMATYSPALGMIGTLIGLVQMLQNMDDPSSIGPAMAVALITTFYGAIMANVLFSPLAGKLSIRAKEETAMKEMILSGILAISNGDNPRIVEQKLNAYLEPSQQISMFEND